jgi:hypothetical protein
MNLRLIRWPLLAIALAMAIPSAHVHSQLAPAPGDPLAELRAMEGANDDLIKRQETTLADLAEITETANQVRIFSKRG